jgi:hypothetical protein
MPARLAYPMLYRLVTDSASAERTLEIDELLGDPSAAARREAQRRAAVAESAFEVAD